VLLVTATLLGGALLALAWFAVVIQRRNPPLSLTLEPSVEGILTVDLSAAVRWLPKSGVTSADIKDHLDLFQSRGEVHFYRPDGNRLSPWVAFFPLQRPQRLYRRRVERVIEESGVFQGTSLQYRILPEGLIVWDQLPTPLARFRAVGVSGSLAAEYRTDADHLPEHWLARIPRRDVRWLTDHVVQAIVWEDGDSTPTLRAQTAEGVPHTIPYFHPLGAP
jgi:hypothetical protein